MTAHEVLVAARNVIDREGWEQRYEGDDETAPRCAMSGLWFAAGVEFDAERSARGALADVIGVESCSADVGEWNDAPGRTKAEVLAAFDAAIAATAPLPADPFPRDVAPKAKSLTLDRSAVLSGGGEQ